MADVAAILTGTKMEGSGDTEGDRTKCLKGQCTDIEQHRHWLIYRH